MAVIFALVLLAQSVFPGKLNAFGDLAIFNGCTQHTSVNNGATTVVKNSAGKYCGFVMTTQLATNPFKCFDNASALSGTIIDYADTTLVVGAHGNTLMLGPVAFANGLTCGSASGAGVMTIFWQ